MSSKLLLAAGTALALSCAAPASAQTRTYVAPYIELGQTLDADLKGGDTVTYSSIAVGVDGSIQTRRAEAQASVRYERRFGWGRNSGDDDVASGLARAAIKVATGLTLEGGALATRARSDIRGAAPGTLVGDVDNVSQIYAFYAGPSYATRAGAVDVNASYLASYTKVEAPGTTGIRAGQQRLDYYDDSFGQIAQVSAGVAPNTVLPVGLTASAAYEREDAGQLKSRYEGYYARGDVLAPVSPTVALQGGVGYERIETSQRDALRDSNGAPVIDGNGRFVTDPNGARRVAYRTDGVYYDAGVVWRPNHRTELQGRVGKRYGSVSYTGSLSYQASKTAGLRIAVYDGVQTFGRQLRQGLQGLPTSFVSARDAFTQQYNGCVFGTSGASPGGCLNDVFQSVSTASYRARGIDGVIVDTRGLATYGFGAGYANRKLYTPNLASGVTITGFEDESYYAEIFYARSLGRVSGIDANAFVNYYESGLPGSDGVLAAGTTGSYYHYFGRLGTTASVGLYSFRVGDFDSDLSLQAQLAARYTF